MENGLKRIGQKIRAFDITSAALWLGILTTFLAVGLYGYLGTFSRYAGDDYCLSAFFYQEGDFVDRMVQRYQISSSRYTNILFIGLVDVLFGWYNVAVLPPLMLGLFVLGAFLLLNEIVRLASLGWSRWITLFLAMLVVYFSIMQAPSLYDTLYWRAGMTSHFAPLVFLAFLGAIVVREVRLASERPSPPWVLALCFLAALLIGGFSEPPAAVMVTVLALAMAALWLWGDPASRRSRSPVLLFTLAGALTALAILAVAPANSLRLGNPPPGLFLLLFRTFKYPLEFVVDVFRSLPVSSLITFLLPAVLFYMEYSKPGRALSGDARKRIGLLLLAVLLLSYLLIAASFAPSVYGQSFPIGRARFPGRVILTCALMMKGALIGIWLVNFRTKPPASAVLRGLAATILVLLTLYPLRTVARTSAEIPVYRQRAATWDARDVMIRSLQAEGVRELRVPFLDGEVLQDLGDRTGFRLNRCASLLYGVDTILALPMDNGP